MSTFHQNLVKPADVAVSITDNNATHGRCRGVWVGVSQSIDLSVDGSTWVLFKGATAGTVIPVQAVGVRKTSGSAAPDAGDVVFLY
jgi:hypothetical protein